MEKLGNILKMTLKIIKGLIAMMTLFLLGAWFLYIITYFIKLDKIEKREEKRKQYWEKL